MKNIGPVDRMIRILIGVALLMAFFLEGNVRYLYLIGLIPLATAVINWCPLYSLLGIKTCECKKC